MSKSTFLGLFIYKGNPNFFLFILSYSEILNSLHKTAHRDGKVQSWLSYLQFLCREFPEKEKIVRDTDQIIQFISRLILLYDGLKLRGYGK